MFDLSLAEIVLVVLVAVVFIGPKELPVVIRAVVKAMRYMRGLMHEVRGMFDDLAKETGIADDINDLKADVKMIKGEDGKWYESYPHIAPPIAPSKPAENHE